LNYYFKIVAQLKQIDYICVLLTSKTNIMTHKAGLTDWRIKVMETLKMDYTIKNGQIIYKGELEITLVNFLVEKRIELGIHPF